MNHEFCMTQDTYRIVQLSKSARHTPYNATNPTKLEEVNTRILCVIVTMYFLHVSLPTSVVNQVNSRVSMASRDFQC